MNEEIARAYRESLERHIEYVRQAGQKIGVSQARLDNHDKSKWLEVEFNGYAMHFHGGGAPDLFACAWLHHIHHNDHHWQHWVFPDGFVPKNSQVSPLGAIEMPVGAVQEMVADWLGASKAYTGSWDMTDWLVKNTPRIILHPKTRAVVLSILKGLGYGEFK